MMPSDDELFKTYFAQTFLSKQIVFTSVGDLSDEQRRSIPETWLQIGQQGGRAAVELVLESWKSVLPTQLPRFLDVLDRYGWDIRLARVTLQGRDPSIVLIYIFRGDGVFGEGFDMRLGFPPRRRDQLPPLFASLPESLTRFYTDVHDGFLTNLWAGPAGLRRSADVCAASQYAGEITECSWRDINGKPLRDSTGLPVTPDRLPDLSRLVEVCNNHGLARLLVDLDAGEDLAWELWGGWSGRLLERWPQPLWVRLDDWLMMAFDSYQPREPE